MKEMFWKLFFFIYRYSKAWGRDIRLKNYLHIYKKQLQVSLDFSFGQSLIIEILSGNANVKIGSKVSMRNFCNILCSDNGVLNLGDNVFFNNYCSINCLHKITIGDNTIFGEGVKLYDHNHLFYVKQRLIREQGMKYGAIEIGKNCWFGSNTIILPNVTIGDNVVIGANNLIYKSIPSDTIVMSKSDVLLKSY